VIFRRPLTTLQRATHDDRTEQCRPCPFPARAPGLGLSGPAAPRRRWFRCGGEQVLANARSLASRCLRLSSSPLYLSVNRCWWGRVQRQAANLDPALVGVRAARARQRRCGPPPPRCRVSTPGRGRVRGPGRAHQRRRRQRSCEVSPGPWQASAGPRGMPSCWRKWRRTRPTQPGRGRRSCGPLRPRPDGGGGPRPRCRG
jgi:hypothetical protein